MFLGHDLFIFFMGSYLHSLQSAKLVRSMLRNHKRILTKTGQDTVKSSHNDVTQSKLDLNVEEINFWITTTVIVISIVSLKR